jgi:DNA-binding LacI/PurR family transcriptional regulator
MPDPIPLSRTAEARFQRHIRDNGLRPGDRLPSERKLAASWGLTRSAVNRGAGALIARGVLRRAGYRLFVADVSGADRVPGPIFVFDAVPELARGLPRMRGVSVAVAEVAQRYGRYCVVVAARSGAEQQRRLTALAGEAMADPRAVGGVVVWPTDSGVLPALRRLTELRVPVVVLDQEFPAFDSVTTDNAAGVASAVAYLRSLGHAHLCYVTRDPTDRPSLAARKVGYQQSCLQAGLTRSVERVRVLDPKYDGTVSPQPGAAEAVTEVFASSPEVTAFVCSNDDVAEAVIAAVVRSGRRVPMSYSVTGFDGWTLPPLGGLPRVTTVVQDYDRIAMIGAEVLFMRLTGGLWADYPEPVHLRLAPELAVRRSTSRAVPRLRRTKPE